MLTQGAPGDFLQALQLLALMALAHNMPRPPSVVLFPAVLTDDFCHQDGDLLVRSKGERFCQDLKQGPQLYPTLLWQSGLGLGSFLIQGLLLCKTAKLMSH